jgi:hypothetical protein
MIQFEPIFDGTHFHFIDQSVSVFGLRFATFRIPADESAAIPGVANSSGPYPASCVWLRAYFVVGTLDIDSARFAYVTLSGLSVT